jgi:hypothetical protein
VNPGRIPLRPTSESNSRVVVASAAESVFLSAQIALDAQGMWGRPGLRILATLLAVGMLSVIATVLVRYFR